VEVTVLNVTIVSYQISEFRVMSVRENFLSLNLTFSYGRNRG